MGKGFFEQIEEKAGGKVEIYITGHYKGDFPNYTVVGTGRGAHYTGAPRMRRKPRMLLSVSTKAIFWRA